MKKLRNMNLSLDSSSSDESNGNENVSNQDVNSIYFAFCISSIFTFDYAMHTTFILTTIFQIKWIIVPI